MAPSNSLIRSKISRLRTTKVEEMVLTEVKMANMVSTISPALFKETTQKRTKLEIKEEEITAAHGTKKVTFQTTSPLKLLPTCQMTSTFSKVLTTVPKTS